MTPAITLLAALSVSLVALLFLYAATLRYIVRRCSRSFPSRAIIPVIAPIFAWRLGARALPIAFGASVVVYGALQVTARLGGWS